MEPIPIEQLDAWLAALLNRMENASFRSALVEVHSELIRGNARNFEKQQSSTGAPWPARKDNFSHPLLRLLLSMYNAAAVPGGAGQVEQLGDRESAIGVSLDAVPYARAQNFGYHHLPAREFFYATDETLERCDALIEDGAALLF